MAKALTKPEPTDQPATDLDRIRSLETPELRAELAAAIGLTARHLMHLAAVWAELERRGEDLSDLRTGIGVYLPAIAAGTVTPEAVVAFAGQPTLMRAVASLPPDQQKRLASGGTVPVVEKQGDSYTHRMLPASALTAGLARQVFGERTIRTEAEQIALLTPAIKPPKPGRAPKRGKLRADRDKGTILLGRRVLPLADVLAAVADLRRPDTATADELDVPVVVKLTAAEKQRLGHAVVDSGKTQQDLVRDALRAMGLI